jgi:hypothetical protein
LENGKPKALYQSCYDLADFEIKEREIKNLRKAGRKLDCRELILVVKQGDESLRRLKEIKIVSSEMFLN